MSEPLTLVLGNRTYSSWSLRGWLLMKLTGQTFDEEMIWLDDPGYKPKMLAATNGFGTVPTLRIGDRAIGDSMAIAEYAAEIAAPGQLWPEDPVDRAEARMLTAKMHAGFQNLRAQCPMNLSNVFEEFTASPEVLADIETLEALLCPVLARSGGPFLYGEAFGAADAFYAPVAARIRTFRLPVSAQLKDYIDTVLSHPLMDEWTKDAAKEPGIERDRTDRLASGWFEPGTRYDDAG